MRTRAPATPREGADRMASRETSGTNYLQWGKTEHIDNAAVRALSCAGSSLCVAIDVDGRVLASTRPGDLRRPWKTVYRPANGSTLDGLSCASARLCVAIDTGGDVIASAHPAETGSWSVARVDPSPLAGVTALTGISCASRWLCVAVGASGNAVVSTDPALGAWSVHRIDPGIDYECFHYGGTGAGCASTLAAVSCASRGRCVAIDTDGRILSTDDPTESQPWSDSGAQPSTQAFSYIACTSSPVCLLLPSSAPKIVEYKASVTRLGPSAKLPAAALDGIWCSTQRVCFTGGPTAFAPPPQHDEIFESADATSAKPTWRRTGAVHAALFAIACPESKLCLAADGTGALLIGEPRPSRR